MCAGELVRQAGIEQKSKWLGKIVSDRAVDVYIELLEEGPVSYTHLTLPTNREV